MNRGTRASGYRHDRTRVTRRQWEKLAVALAATAIVIAVAALAEAVSRAAPPQPGLVCSEIFQPDHGQPFPVYFRCSRSRP